MKTFFPAILIWLILSNLCSQSLAASEKNKKINSANLLKTKSTSNVDSCSAPKKKTGESSEKDISPVKQSKVIYPNSSENAKNYQIQAELK